MKGSTPRPAGTGSYLTSQAPGLRVSSLPTLPIHARSHARLVLFVPAQSRLAGAGPEADCQVCGSYSGVWGLWDSAQHPAPPTQCLCSAPCHVGSPLCPELKSLGALRVNDRAVPFSLCAGRRPNQGGWCQGSPHPRWRCSVMSLAGGVGGGHRLVLSPREGRTGATVTGSAPGPAVPIETPAAQQPHRLLLMSGDQLLFPWVFWAGSRGKARGGGCCRGQSKVGWGCMSVLVAM